MSTEQRGWEPVFPIADFNVHPGPWGLTKRELFAAMAMQGFCGHHELGEECSAKTIAQMAVEQADALLTALKETP